MVQLYLDCDGVLADMEGGVRKLTGKGCEEQPVSSMWRACAMHPDFFGSLDWMPDEFGGKALWDAVKHLEPKVLTGIPYGGWAPRQKRGWGVKMLGPHVEVITCWSKEKYLHCKPGDILVDDRKKAQGPWEAAGGVFVLHTTTKNTLEQLKKLGIL